MSINLIATVSNDSVIGTSVNETPWEPLIEDLGYFSERTKEGIVVMGRKTFESLGNQPIGARNNIVLTRKARKAPRGVQNLNFCNSPQDILRLAKKKDIWIIGGGMVFNTFITAADSIHISRIYGEYIGKVKFPNIPKGFTLDTLTDPIQGISGAKWHREVFIRK